MIELALDSISWINKQEETMKIDNYVKEINKFETKTFMLSDYLLVL